MTDSGRGRALTLKTLALASGQALTALSTLLATAVLTRALSVDEYATHRQALMIYGVAAPLLMLGLPKALFFFLPGETRRARAVIVENLILLTLGGLVFAVALPLGGARLAAARFENPGLAEPLLLMAPYALCLAPVAALGACLTATDRVGPLLRFNIASRALLLAMIAAAAVLFHEAWATLLAHALWAALLVVPAIWLMLRAVPATGERRPSRAGLRSQLSYSVPLGLAGLLGALSAQLDKLIVSSMCSTREFAIYVTGALELPLVGIITRSMGAAVLPEFTKAHKSGEPGDIIALWQQAMHASLLLLAPVMYVVLLLGPELMRFLFSDDYIEAAAPLRVYALLLPLRSAVYGSVLMATDRTRFVTVSAALALAVNAGLSVLFVRWLGPTGAAWATVLTVYATTAVTLWPMADAVHCRVRDLIAWAAVFRVLLAAGAPAALTLGVGLLVPLSGTPRLFALGLLQAALTLGAYHLLGLGGPRTLWRTLRGRRP
ncbi:MAG: oligosaccharide flippase family protein [Myxococcales bacterium]|nr:oligosaccharide flippase family protein [Myxococcales bacterium]